MFYDLIECWAEKWILVEIYAKENYSYIREYSTKKDINIAFQEVDGNFICFIKIKKSKIK